MLNRKTHELGDVLKTVLVAIVLASGLLNDRVKTGDKTMAAIKPIGRRYEL